MMPKNSFKYGVAEEEIISAAYGDSGWIKRLKIRKQIKNNPEAVALYKKHKMIAVQVHSLPEEECPEYLLNSAINNARESNYEKSAGHIKPAFSAVLVIVLILLSVLLFEPEKYEQNNYTQEEIITAEKQAKESITLIGKILNKASSSLEAEILPKHVSKPIKKSLTIITNLIGG